MSRFFSSKYKNLVPYVPGEQPKDFKYIKLNTNESPYPPSKKALKYAKKASKRLHLYPDPECYLLTEDLAKLMGVERNEILLTNGSDEILNFIFMAYCDENHEAVFPDITYGFYKVFAQINNIAYSEIPLKDDFTINIDDYVGIGKNIFIANPNAPTGIEISQKDIARIAESNPDNIVVIDEAYVDFGAESAVALTGKYDNLIVTQTYSKSRSMAGARLGYAIASKEIIQDLNTIKYSTNPYNINTSTMMAGLGCVHDNEYTLNNCMKIQKVRESTVKGLKDLGFTLTDSKANFIFAKHEKYSGEKIYTYLKSKGILVRHFSGERIKDYNRITVGTASQMSALLDALKNIPEEM